MAYLVGIAQGEELAGSEVVLEILFGLFVPVDLDIADGEIISVRGGCIAIACDWQIERDHVLADTQSPNGMNAQSFIVRFGRGKRDCLRCPVRKRGAPVARVLKRGQQVGKDRL